MRTFEDIEKEINRNLNHDIDYADDRNELVKGLLDKNDWIIDLLSDEGVRSKQVKSKNDALAENQNLDKKMERIADYILFPKFDSHEQEEDYNYLRKKEKEISNARRELNKSRREIDKNEYNIKKEEFDKLLKSTEESLRSFSKNHLTSNQKRNIGYREKLLDNVSSLLIDMNVETKSPEKVKDKPFSLDIDEDYWERMGFSKEQSLVNQEILNTYEDSIESIKKDIGLHLKGKDNQDRFKEKLIERFDANPIVYIRDGELVSMDSNYRYFKLRKMYGELVSDFNKAKEILAEPIHLNNVSESTEYNYNSDTWYVDDEGNEVFVSSNHVRFSNPDTYKGMIQNYKSLKDHYRDEFSDDMWAILWDFESILMNTSLSKEEKYVVDMLMDNRSRKDIIRGFICRFDKSISERVLSSWINTTIPNKLVNTYIEMVDDWLYTYKIKGDYKKCSSCNRVKLISNDRYFSPNSNSTDGFYSKCRECRRIGQKA